MGINISSAVAPERRPAPRSQHHYRVRLEVEDGFFEPFILTGYSRNLSPDGVRVRVERKVASGSRCRVTFLDAAGRLRPNMVQATVRNVTREVVGGRKIFEVGLEFDAPLEFMKRPGVI